MITPFTLMSLADMLRMNTPALTDALNTLGVWRARLNKQHGRFPDFQPTDIAPPVVVTALVNDAKCIRRAARQIGALVTCATIEDFLAAVKSNQANSFGICDTWVIAIHSTLRREMNLFSVFLVPQAKAEYVEPKEPLFGRDVSLKLPSAAFDIEEAGKCFGLARPTASVFHLMRVMEMTLSSLGHCLALPDPVRESERNWGKMIERIQTEMKRRGANGGSGWSTKADKAFFTDVVASLDAVRVAWRNPTMHVDSRYTQEEAEHIFAAVKGLTRKVASRMDEAGAPVA